MAKRARTQTLDPVYPYGEEQGPIKDGSLHITTPSPPTAAPPTTLINPVYPYGAPDTLIEDGKILITGNATSLIQPGPGLGFQDGKLTITENIASLIKASPPLANVNGTMTLKLSSPLSVDEQNLTLNISDPLSLNQNSALVLNLSNPLSINQSALSLNVSNPLALKGDALGVNVSNPLSIQQGSLSLNVSNPLSIDGNSLSINASDPLFVSQNSLALKTSNPLTVDQGSLTLSASAPLQTTGNSLSLNTSSPLKISNSALTLSLSPGFSTASDGSLQYSLSSELTVANGFLRITNYYYAWTGPSASSNFIYKNNVVKFFLSLERVGQQVYGNFAAYSDTQFDHGDKFSINFYFNNDGTLNSSGTFSGALGPRTGETSVGSATQDQVLIIPSAAYTQTPKVTVSPISINSETVAFTDSFVTGTALVLYNWNVPAGLAGGITFRFVMPNQGTTTRFVGDQINFSYLGKFR